MKCLLKVTYLFLSVDGTLHAFSSASGSYIVVYKCECNRAIVLMKFSWPCAWKKRSFNK